MVQRSHVLPVRADVVEGQDDVRLQMNMLKMLVDLPLPTAIGVCCSFLLHCALNHHEVLRRVMNEKVVRTGFTGESLLQVINRECR